MSGKRQITKRFRDKTSYSLYCVNIYGSGLKAIKDEFKRQVGTGLRQTLFMVDLEELQEDLNNQPRNTKMRKELKENFNTYIINSLIQHIQGFCKEYELLTNKINEELKFDLYEYWLQHIEEKPKMSLDKTDKIKEKKTAKLSNASKLNKINCISSLKAREHNRVGQSKLMSQRKYIKDEPTSGKLYIIILGQMSEHFYTDLLRRDQPLEGIINFIPTESNYDIMLGNNKLRNFIAETLEIINSSIYQIRQEVFTKQVGLFNHNLPIISNCLATKHSREIYDQLTWSIYDMDMLKQQYEMYYYRPYQVIDVGIPVGVNLTQLYHADESLCIQGNFQKCNLPISGTDLASIAGYLNSLLNTSDLSEELQQSCSNISLQNSFSSVTKIPKYERLIVAENNKLLLNMVQYADLNRYQSIYLCCLDYSILRQYAMSSEQQFLPTFIRHDEQNLSNFESLTLPKYVKFYANADCSGQRITELLKEYDNCEIQEISPGYKLYTFKRFYNALNEDDGRVIIPTRLCFRDFSLYQMEEFLKNLKIPQLNTDSPSEESIQEKKVKTVEFNENMFIRPNSLKALKLQKERSSEENRSRKSESRSSRSKNEKKSSLNKSTTKTEESMGLPQDHPLLMGYNLEDTLQEVKYKVSKYYFKLGFVKLYEEMWCFQVMNKQLALAINNATIFFHKPRRELKGLGNNIRLITNNNIDIRILNDPLECSKIVMNYPNSLSVFHHDNYCEQVWNCDQTFRNEQRRIYTTLGAIIVFFKSNDMIMIMRYNGEVYRLYQHEPAEEEEEEQGFTTDAEDVQEKSSGFKDLKAQGDSRFIIDKTKYLEHKKPKGKTTAATDQQETQRKSDLHTLNSKKSRPSQKIVSEESIQMSTKSNSVTNNLRSAVTNEVNFLNLLSSTYELQYLHLIITTSLGRRINLTHQGEIFEGPHCSIKEWHDYFANETYCERSDGVKMIWSQDCFKCFHKDGSVFKTTIDDDIFREEVDEFESQITQSSSHNLIKSEIEDNGEKQELEGNFTQTVETLGKLLSTYTITEAAEEYITLDVPFVSYSFNSWFMQHQNYAEVYVLTPKLPNLSPSMEIFGIDNIRIYTHEETFFKADDSNVCDYDSLQSEGEEYTTDKLNIKVVVNVNIGDQLHVTADKEACEVYVVLGQSKVEKERKSDSLTLSLKYTDCINDAFKYLVNEIASFETNNRHKKEEFYYIEQMNKDSVIRGFEFFSKLPQLSLYNYHVSNNITQLKAVNTINELMTNICDGYKEDLNKFPRFKHPHKQDIDAIVDVPQVLSANIFIEIPKQLRNMANITKFLEPFECINFKKLRRKFKNILNFYLKPQQLNDLKTFSSTKNWKRRHWEHERRLFNEQQRLGLYQAMSKHKIYPNYWKFTNVYKGEIRHIEFFEFMQNKCDNNEEKASN